MIGLRRSTEYRARVHVAFPPTVQEWTRSTRLRSEQAARTAAHRASTDQGVRFRRRILGFADRCVQKTRASPLHRPVLEHPFGPPGGSASSCDGLDPYTKESAELNGEIPPCEFLGEAGSHDVHRRGGEHRCCPRRSLGYRMARRSAASEESGISPACSTDAEPRQLPFGAEGSQAGARQAESPFVDEVARLPPRRELRVEAVKALDLEERVRERDQTC